MERGSWFVARGSWLVVRGLGVAVFGGNEPDADQRADGQHAEDHSGERALCVDVALVGLEHQTAVGVLGDRLECGGAVEVLASVAQQNSEKPSAHEIARGLPEAHVRLGDCLDASCREVGVHLADAGRHFGEMFVEAEALEVCGQAPAGASLRHVLAHGLVIDGLRGELVHAGPYGVAFGLGTARHALGHGVEVLVSLKDWQALLVCRREGHEADLVGGEVEVLGEVCNEVFAAEHTRDLALHEEVSNFVRERELRQRAHNSARDESLEELGRAQAFGRVEAGLPLLAAAADHVAACRSHPGEEAPWTVLDTERALAALYGCAGYHLVAVCEALAPCGEVVPCARRRFGVEPCRLHEVLAVDEAVVGEAGRGNGIHFAVLGGDVAPERGHVLPAGPFCLGV